MNPAGNRAPGIGPVARPGVVARIRLGILGCAALLALVLASSAHWSLSLAREEYEVEARAAVRMASGHAEWLLGAAELLLRSVARLNADTDWDDPAAAARSHRALDELRGTLPTAFRIFLWDAEGRLRASTAPEIEKAPAIVDQDFFETHRDPASGLYLSDPLPGPVEGTAMLVLSRRTEGSAGFGGVASMAVMTEDIRRFYMSLGFSEQTSFAWFRDDGRILVRQPRTEITRISGPLQDLIAPGTADGRVRYESSADGVTRTVFFRRLEGRPLYVSVGITERAILERWVQRSAPYLLVGALTIAGFAFGARHALRWAGAEDARRRALDALNAELEARVEERTATLQLALDHKAWLLKEVNHRVKNSLQMVSSLLNMQIRSSDRDDVRDRLLEARNRVQAIGHLHQRLYQTDHFETVDFGQFLKELASDQALIAGAADTVCTVEIPEHGVLVPIDRAVPLSLIANELLTNAIKHAGSGATAREGEGTRVLVRLEGMEDGGLALTVSDDGPGLPPGFDPDGAGHGASGLGMRLVRGLVSQLGARLEMPRNQPELGPGAVFRVVLPPGT
ncbi:sensor histidine kinase [Arenibaculum pallidiluteum]|uniref:sensor histidine kinase n=1 Tax=Arenibaculum pallidiluteum TaxID=2812559 RepID=UPI001A95BB73|nr:histidine kinase dimerization/phosphoacceptor domain -containing protein [Arenibaculum pallidiluteum]